MNTESKLKPVYEDAYHDMRMMILCLSGLTEEALEDAAIELETDYEVFLSDYRGQYLIDAHVGFLEMLRQWGAPFPYLEESCLNELTLPQYFLAWAWNENNSARYCLGQGAIAHGREPSNEIECGVVAAISAVKSLCHAQLLLAVGQEKVAWYTRHSDGNQLQKIVQFRLLPSHPHQPQKPHLAAL